MISLKKKKGKPRRNGNFHVLVAIRTSLFLDIKYNTFQMHMFIICQISILIVGVFWVKLFYFRIHSIKCKFDCETNTTNYFI